MYRFLLIAAFCGFSHALYGGKEIEIEDAPYVVSVRERLHHRCGGSVIAEDWVLTMANCVDAFVENFGVLAGSKYRDGGSRHEIVEVKYHVPDGSMDKSFEPALLRVSPPITGQTPVSLVNEDFKLEPNASLRIHGFGYTDGFVPSKTLRSIEARSMLLEDCVKAYSWRFGSLYPGMGCAEGISGASACSYDAGDPVVLEDGRLVALVTSRTGCGHDSQPDVLARVYRVRAWIRLVTGV